MPLITTPAAMKAAYDFIVCGSGSAGSVVARRLAENPVVSVLLLEAGGTDEIDAIMEPRAWPLLLASEQNWGFTATPNPQLNNRAVPLPMGKVLGGGSSINVLCWVRGHRDDWDHFAAEAGDESWNYQSILKIYRRIENWLGTPDGARRGAGGPVTVQPAPDPHPLALAMIDAFADAGIPRFDDHNGAMMEGDGGVALTNVIIREGRRQSIFRAYVHPYLERENLTVLTGAAVTGLVLAGNTAEGVRFQHGGKQHTVRAGSEIVLSLGAIHTPKILMLSGIGDRDELKRFDIPVVQHLPGVGRNFQDHVMAPCLFESRAPIEGRNNLAEATALWKSGPAVDGLDFQCFIAELPFAAPETLSEAPPAQAWALTPALLRTKSRGRVRLTGAAAEAPVEIDANFFGDPQDAAKLKECVEFCRMIGHSPAFRPFMKREVVPGAGHDGALDAFLKNGTLSHFHETCTAKMGRDSMSVVDGKLKVYGVDRLRVVDASIMPRVVSGNTMAPTVVIGERGAEILKAAHKL